MDILHCQRDYAENTVVVQFTGELDETKAVEYVEKCYPSLTKLEILASSPHEFIKGYEQLGSVTYKIIDNKPRI